MLEFRVNEVNMYGCQSDEQLTWQVMYGPLKLKEDNPKLLSSSVGDGLLSHFQQYSSCSTLLLSLLLSGHSKVSEKLQGRTEAESGLVSY